jgi:hypothetical protein
MMVVFAALLAAAFVCATLKAGVQNDPATQTEPVSTNSAQ